MSKSCYLQALDALLLLLTLMMHMGFTCKQYEMLLALVNCIQTIQLQAVCKMMLLNVSKLCTYNSDTNSYYNNVIKC